MKMKVMIGALLLTCLSSVCQAQSKQVRKGNKFYEQQKYDEAAASYQQALQKNPAYAPGLFNLGNALFRQDKLDAARKAFGATAKQSPDKHVEANADYNIGNTYMKEQKWQEAANAYKDALRKNPSDEAAKYNLSYALTMMKHKQNKNNKNNKQNKNQQNQDKKDQNKNNQDQEKNKDQNKENQDKDQQQKDQQQNEEKQKADQEQQHPEPQPSKLSKEQAEQLLNALAQEEKKLHDKKEKGKAVKIKLDKDW